MNITEFLEARIAEDEAVAAAVTDPDIGSVIWCAQNDGAVTGDEAMEQSSYVNRYTTARALAECEAKRKIIDLHGRMSFYDGDTCTMCTDSGPEAQIWPCATLRALAAVHKDHPDYASIT